MTIKSFQDLDVYQRAYTAAITVVSKIVRALPSSEKYDLSSQLARSAKAIAPLIAEGFAKKHLPRGFHKYLDDALGEANEVIVHLSYCKDLYADKVDIKLCEEMVSEYNIIGKQLNKLSQTWRNFSRKPDTQ